MKIGRKVILTAVGALVLPLIAQAHTVKTDFGNGSDIEMVEQNLTPARNDVNLNTRSNGSDRNEVVGLRFDLTGYEIADMTNVVINLVNYRDNSTRSIMVYGVTNGATGGTGNFSTETWSDTNVVAFGDLPGLEETDGNIATVSIDPFTTTLLVDPTNVGGTKGAVDSVSSSNLTSFVKNNAGTGSITFLIVAGNTSGGQYRFASREADALDGGAPSGAAGDFAPYLEFDLTTDDADNIPPSVVSVSPTNGAVGVDLDLAVEVTFDEAMDETSITAGSFFLYQGTNPVPATVSYSPITLTATLTPDAFSIDGSTTYTATVTDGVTDEAGNPLPSSVVWSFTTRALTPDDPVRVVVDADSYLTNGQNGDASPTQNHGSKSLWEVRWYDDQAGTSRIHIGYLRFDISSINPAEYSEIKLSGSFASTSYNGPGTWEVWGLNDNVVSNDFGRLGNDWAETAVNYSNAAGISNDAPQGSWSVVSNETAYLGTITLDGAGIEFSSNPTNLLLASFLEADTDGMITLIVMSDTFDGEEYRIDTKEGSSSGGHRPVTLDFIGSAGPVDPPVINGIAAGAGPSILVTWSGSSSRIYNVERATDLVAANWTAVATGVPGDSANTYTDAPPIEAQAAYRIVDDGVAP